MRPEPCALRFVLEPTVSVRNLDSTVDTFAIRPIHARMMGPQLLPNDSISDELKDGETM